MMKLTFSFGFGPATVYAENEWAEAITQIPKASIFEKNYLCRKTKPHSMGGTPSLTMVSKDKGHRVALSPTNCKVIFTEEGDFDQQRDLSISIVHEITNYWQQTLCLPGVSLRMEDIDDIFESKIVPPFVADISNLKFELTLKPTTKEAPLVDTVKIMLNKASTKSILRVSGYATLADEDDMLVGYPTEEFFSSNGVYLTFLKQFEFYIRTEFEKFRGHNEK